MRHRRHHILLGLLGVAVVMALGLASLPYDRHAEASVSAGTAAKVKHVMVIYQENHSFDNVLGALCRTRTKRCDGFTGTVTLKDGTRVPMTKSPDVSANVVHSVASQQAAINGGAMDGWASVYGCDAAHGYACLSYYTPSQIPNLARLARTYTVSDRTFSMSDSPSWGGHLYAAAASLGGFTGDNPKAVAGVKEGPGWGCNSNKIALWRNGRTGRTSMEPSCIPDRSLDPAVHPYGGAFRATPVPQIMTVFDRLDAVGLPWRIYGEPTPGNLFSICPSFAECYYTKQADKVVPTAQVLTDAAAGKLPAYSVLTPSKSSTAAIGADTSQHNGRSMLAGDNWIGRIVAAVEKGPDALSTAIFITYDDCGCFYDHVRPGANPDGTRQGPRMPMVIVSPYAKPGYTDSTGATYASILAFAEHTFGLKPLTANDARAYDYANAFDFTQRPLSPPPMSEQALSPGTVTYLRTHPADEDDPT